MGSPLQGYVDVTKHPHYKHPHAAPAGAEEAAAAAAAAGGAPKKELSAEEQAKVYADYKAAMTPEKRAEFEAQIKKAREAA